MTLDNLLEKSLEAIEPDLRTIRRLLAAAKRNIDDAKLLGLSNENRFDAAYKAIMQLSNASLQACGYRTLTSRPGHHQIMIQSLTKTIDLDTDTMILLDALRKQRNVADYSGDTISDATVEACLESAEELITAVNHRLLCRHPALYETQVKTQKSHSNKPLT